MKKQEWKKEYGKWRLYFRAFSRMAVTDDCVKWAKFDDVWEKAFHEHFRVLHEVAPASVYEALTYHPVTHAHEINSWHAIRCNLDLTREACERIRLEARGVDYYNAVVVGRKRSNTIRIQGAA